MNVSEARKEAMELIKKKGFEAIALRSCWNCNSLHDHLKESECIIRCFVCGNVFFKGVDVTTE